MYERYLDGSREMSDIDLVELILFYSIPHKDVRPIAEELIKRYGSLTGILGVPAATLMSVPGVGEKTAAMFKLLGDLAERCAATPQPAPEAANVSNTVSYFKEYFKNLDSEQLVVALLDDKGKIIKKFVYGDSHRKETTVRINELAVEVAKISPSAAVIAHNHFSGVVTPSEADDLSTKKLAFMFNVQGVTLFDHLIFCGDKFFSYHTSGRLDIIKESIINTMI